MDELISVCVAVIEKVHKSHQISVRELELQLKLEAKIQTIKIRLDKTNYRMNSLLFVRVSIRVV